MLDQELLAGGQLAISRASGIFPDGLLFDIPGPDQPPPSKALAECFDPGMRDLDIYLTVPDYKQKGRNVALTIPDDRQKGINGAGPGGAEPSRVGGSRYLAETTVVRDDNTGSGEKPIRIAREESAFAGGERDSRRVLRAAHC